MLRDKMINANKFYRIAFIGEAILSRSIYRRSHLSRSHLSQSHLSQSIYQKIWAWPVLTAGRSGL